MIGEGDFACTGYNTGLSVPRVGGGVMARIVSFVVLVTILLVIAALFFQVMAVFLLPMFLALLLVIMFQPLHRWFLVRCRGREKTAAGLTTATVLLIVLAPLAIVLVQAIVEGIALYQYLEVEQISVKRLAGLGQELGDRLGLTVDPDNILRNHHRQGPGVDLPGGQGHHPVLRQLPAGIDRNGGIAVLLPRRRARDDPCTDAVVAAGRPVQRATRGAVCQRDPGCRIGDPALGVSAGCWPGWGCGWPASPRCS